MYIEVTFGKGLGNLYDEYLFIYSVLFSFMHMSLPFQELLRITVCWRT